MSMNILPSTIHTVTFFGWH